MVISTFLEVVYVFLFWWVLFLIFHRVLHRSPKVNTWKKDLLLTGLQTAFSLVVLIAVSFFWGRH
ncbi:hypothetical protein ACQKJC_20180 [Priestia koreensis]|uniref:hypothetical protein n=1 Tax=Priestia koreensis TaxID=284581 RepID=UPI003CFD1238